MVAPASLPEDRKALVFAVYSEALDEDERVMLPDHVRDWRNFAVLAPRLDGVFAHTPDMVSSIARRLARPSFLLPVGWDPVMGTPRWQRPKDHEALFAGSMIGRRARLVPLLAKHLALTILHGVYGKNMNDAMNSAKTTLYIAHSDVQSYSTWRIWQALASSSMLATEVGDWWPLSSSLCFSLPKLRPGNVSDVARMIGSITREEAVGCAMALHDTLRHFTTSFCLDEYVVRETAEITR
jgi:hypothetical protein